MNEAVVQSESEQTPITVLCDVLADSYFLYLKAHNFHWNVEGPRFRSLHNMFEEHYSDLWNALDDIAERIRALGAYAPGTYAKFKARSSIKENEQIPTAEAMLDELIADNETVLRTLRASVSVAEAHGDSATADLLTERLGAHEKQIWMMRSMRA
ncbi:Dps family protein [Rhodovibrio salinarum]|uniref:DNA starvation/stationary phase protection protein n=1 Tax=Rhodovibrio salinarum TaxID=1087 RepID=A0A934QJV1_9PROT|nr:DNA starvation/stationary phase protection protein [Rhodovibrio salinarum]MBK1698269.1 DNA starvation/stationary phase protection protein [Rhodovibrio salinarum]